MVEKYIKELLYQSDCVIIPGLGAFLCSYAGAELSVNKNKISPPFKKIVFNEKILTIGNNSLQQYIASKESFTPLHVIEKEILSYIEKIKEVLSVRQQYTIDQLGRLYVGTDKNISFEQFDKFNYLMESYGLPDLYFKPVDRTKEYSTIFKPKKQEPMASNYSNQYNEDEEEYEDEDTENSYDEDEEYDDSEELDVEEFARQKKAKKTESYALYYVLAVVALMLTAGTAYYLNMDKETYALGSFDPLAIFRSEKHDSEETEEGENIENKLLPNSEEGEQPSEGTASSETPEKTAMEAPKEEPAQQETAQQNTDANYSSSSSEEINAETGRFYIIAGGFKSEAKAKKFRKQLESDGQDAKVIMPYDGNGVYRVSLGDFTSYKEAKNQKEQLSSAYEGLWVLTY